MTAASRSLATALWGARFASGLLPQSYTTNRDTTADEVYVRFHGPKRWYRHDYSTEELADWATKISDSGAKRVLGLFQQRF